MQDKRMKTLEYITFMAEVFVLIWKTGEKRSNAEIGSDCIKI